MLCQGTCLIDAESLSKMTIRQYKFVIIVNVPWLIIGPRGLSNCIDVYECVHDISEILYDSPALFLLEWNNMEAFVELI